MYTYMGVSILLRRRGFSRSGPETSHKPKQLLGNKSRQVHHLKGNIKLLLGFVGELIFQVRPRSLPREQCPGEFWGKVASNSNT